MLERRIIITDAATADFTQASKLIEVINTEYLLADKGYDSNELTKQAKNKGILAAIPHRKNRNVKRKYDKDLYTLRYLVERAFLHLERWRGKGNRYAKKCQIFLGGNQN